MAKITSKIGRHPPVLHNAKPIIQSRFRRFPYAGNVERNIPTEHGMRSAAY